MTAIGQDASNVTVTQKLNAAAKAIEGMGLQ